MPQSGRIVSGGGHLHGGGIRVELQNATCGTKLFESRPTWGGPKPKPLLHEPGPTKMSSFRSVTGIPVAKGDRLRINAVYDNSAPHTRAMGIMLLFLAPGAVERCGATPALDVDLGRPSAPPAFSMPLPRAPKGKVSRATSTVVGEFQYGAERVVLKRGHHVHVALHGLAPARRHGRRRPRRLLRAVDAERHFTHRFTKAGTYRLFCSLHPSKMVQQITVR